jgi:hypothetical protein
VVHEIAHEEGSHPTQAYYDCLCRIGARLALADPRLIEE